MKTFNHAPYRMLKSLDLLVKFACLWINKKKMDKKSVQFRPHPLQVDICLDDFRHSCCLCHAATSDESCSFESNNKECFCLILANNLIARFIMHFFPSDPQDAEAEDGKQEKKKGAKKCKNLERRSTRKRKSISYR